MKNKGFTLVELLATLVIAAIIITIAVSGFNGISARLKQKSYENKVKLIETSAANYGDETGESAVFIDTLVKEGYIEADDENGLMYDPRDKSIMNCYVISITFENDNVYGKYINEEITTAPDNKICDVDKLKTKYLVVDLKTYEATNDTGTTWNEEEITLGTWTSKNVVLIAEIAEDMKDKVSKITYISNAETEELEVNKDFDSKNKKYISANLLMNTRFTVQVEIKEKNIEGNESVNVYTSQIKVKIDKQRPIIYDSEVVVEGGNEWSNAGKKVKVVASDGQGSGIYGFSISESSDCKNVTYIPNTGNNDTYEIEIKNNGDYYICAKDNVGNLSEDISTKKITINTIDTVPPTCKWSGENTTWTNKDVTIILEGIDNESGSSTKITKTYSSGTTQSEKLSYTIYDEAGNSTLCEHEVKVYVDKDEPNCTFSGESTIWKNGTRIITYGCEDSGSGCNPSYSGSSTTYTNTTKISTTPTYTIKDNAGNEKVCQSKQVNVYLDNTPPTCTSDSGWNSSQWTNNNRTYNYGCSDNDSGCNSSYSGGSKTYTSGTITTATIPSYTIRDSAGNTTTCAAKTVGIYVDKDKPTCKWSGESTNWAKSRTITLTGDDGNGSGIATSTISKVYNRGTIKTDSLNYTIRDNVGNETNCSKTANIYIDNDGPSVPSGGSLGNVSGNNPTGTIKTSATAPLDPNGVGGVKVLYLVTNTSSAPSPNDNRFTTNKNFNRACGTSYYAWAVAEDALGNRSSVKYLGAASDGANAYSSWSGCSVDCGGGTQTRTNSCALVTSGLSQSCNTDECESNDGGCCEFVNGECVKWEPCDGFCDTHPNTPICNACNTGELENCNEDFWN